MHPGPFHSEVLKFYSNIITPEGEANDMNILQRVATLVRANLNDIIDRAEDPEKMIKQLVQDLNNQLIQTKTLVAQSLADQYMLERKAVSAREEAEACERRAQLALDRNNDGLARTALQRMNSFQSSADEMERQLEEQRKETETLKQALGQLETKIAEVTRERDVLLARHRRATAKERISKSQSQVNPDRVEELLNAITGYVDKSEASARAYTELAMESDGRRLTKLEEDDKLDRQLADMKARRQAVIQLE
jgi:phage shock protein A